MSIMMRDRTELDSGDQWCIAQSMVLTSLQIAIESTIITAQEQTWSLCPCVNT